MGRVETIVVWIILAWIALLGVMASATALPSQLQERLAQLPATLQQQLRSRDATWAAMTPAQQQALRQQIRDWDALPEAVRRDRREHWQAWRALPVDQRLQVQAAALTFAALVPQQQQALRTQYAQLDVNERHGWLLGPALGADFASLQPLLQQVPLVQREPLLVVLQAMSSAERRDLAMLVQRTAPQQRDGLRRDLISTSAANRATWLQSRLAQ